MNLKWYYKRLKLMSVEEILYFRIPQLLQFKFFGHQQIKTSPALLNINSDFNEPCYKNKTLEILFKSSSFSSKYSFFTSEIDLFEINNWRKDYQNNISSPLNYYNRIKKQNFALNGDVKFVLEVSRFHFLPFFALKAIQSDDIVYLSKINKILTCWTDQNPYLQSINWISGIEVGIRSVNLIYTHNILKQFDKLSSELDHIIRLQLSWNYQFLKKHLSLYSSANNHLMAELMGLVVIGSYFELSEKDTTKWRQQFFRQIDQQVNKDGVHMELCTRYHAEVTDQILIGLTYLENAGHKIPKNVLNTLKSMFNFTEHVSYKNNDTIFGDNDEGFVINPHFIKDFSLYKSQLASSNFMFNTDYKCSTDVDFRNYLIFGSKFKSYKRGKELDDTLFEDSGYCFMYDHQNETKLSFDVGDIGDTISAAHGHSDILHFNLEVQGRPFLVDPGTYQYHTKHEKWRNYFRGIFAHNTISVNEQHHAQINGRMSWLDTPKTTIDGFSLSPLTSYCKATTNAFKNEGIVHSRKITFNKSEKEISIEDHLESTNTKEKTIQFQLQFHPDVEVNLNNNNLLLTNKGVSVSIENPLFSNARLTKKNVNPIRGWYSSSFNVLKETTRLEIEFVTCEQHKYLQTIINYDIEGVIA